MHELDGPALDRWITGNYGASEHAGATVTCPECGSENVSDRDASARDRAGGSEKPPWRLVCEDCGWEWEDDG